jgi:hypothetical protein
MKKIYITILSSVLALGLNAQTLTQANNSPVVGDMWTMNQVDSTAITPGASGTGVTWNFSTLNVRNISKSYTVVTAASTGSASSYPSASISVKTGALNNFYSSSASSLNFWGGDVSMGGVQVLLTYTSSVNSASYPMNVTNSVNSTVAGNVNVLAQPGTFSGTTTANYDGSGTIMLPSMSVPNAVRLRTNQNLTYTLTFGNGTLTQVRWDYFAPGIKKNAIFSIVTSTVTSFAGTTTETIVTVDAAYVTGVNEVPANPTAFSFFPNPTKDQLTVSFPNENSENASVQIMNALGQEVKKIEIGTGNKGDISLRGLPSGPYFVKLIVGNDSRIEKVIVE